MSARVQIYLSVARLDSTESAEAQERIGGVEGRHVVRQGGIEMEESRDGQRKGRERRSNGAFSHQHKHSEKSTIATNHIFIIHPCIN
jgi:hypothetical protein